MGVLKKQAFKTQGVCSSLINFSVKKGKLTEVVFNGGCSGNAQGLSKLLEGMEINDAVERLRGIRCGGKESSCPDQMAVAILKYIKESSKENKTVPVSKKKPKDQVAIEN